MLSDENPKISFPTVCTRAANARNSRDRGKIHLQRYSRPTLLETRMSRTDGGRISGSHPHSESRSWRALRNVAYVLVTTSQPKSKSTAIATRGKQRIRDLTMIRRKPRKTSRIIFGLIRDCRVQSNHGQHTAGFSFFGSVGIVATQITSGGRAGVVDVLNT